MNPVTAQLLIALIQQIPSLLASASDVKASLQPGATLDQLNAAVLKARQAALADTATALSDLQAAANKG